MDLPYSGTGSSFTGSIRARTGHISPGTITTEGEMGTLTTVESESTGSHPQPSIAFRRGRPSGSQELIEPRLVHQSRALFDACVENIDRALDSDADFFLRCNSLDQLRDSLSRLWGLRSKREEQFAEVINMLQGVFIKTTVENFSTEQLLRLRTVFCELRDQQDAFEDEFANRLTIELLRGDVNVFREMD